MRKMKDSGIEWIGNIPNDWEIKPVGACFKERKEKVSDYEWEPLSVTKQGVIQQLETAAKSDAHDDRKKVCKGDFVINSRSDRKQSCGLSELNGSVSLINIVLENKSLNEKYIKYLLKNYGFAEEFYRWGSGIVADLWSTKYQQMKRIMIPTPPNDEQERITNFLDEKVAEIDRVIEKTKETIEDYKKYKQSIITEAVTKDLIGKNKNGKTKHPNKTKMKYLADINPRSEKEINEDDEVTYTPMEYIKNGYYVQNTGIWKNNTSSYNTYLENDIVMAKVTPCFENGNIAIMNNLIKGIGYGSSELIVFRCKNKIENKYLFYLLQSEIFKKFCVSTMTGTGGLKRVAIDFIKSYVCYIPENAEQKNIINYLDLKCKEIKKIIENKEDLIVELENYKKSLIYEYVTGKKEVTKDVNYSAKEISDWILNKNLENRKNGQENVGITNLKLQKLLYYASGIYFLYKKCNLIKEDFVAWKHGPVIKQIYYKYNSNGAKEIQHNRKSKTEIDNETQEILDKMYSKYSQYTAEELRNMTHKERPWKKTNRNKIIEKDLIKDYFENEYKWEQ